jgi:hypothetical protein
MTRLYIEPEAEEELDQTAARYERALTGLGRSASSARSSWSLPTKIPVPVARILRRGQLDEGGPKFIHAGGSRPVERLWLHPMPSQSASNLVTSVIS